MRAVFRLGFAGIVWACLVRAGVAAEAPELRLLVIGDAHSAYERSAQVLARVDRFKAEQPGVPLAVLLNGDALEYGNSVARRTAGALDFAWFKALAARVPTVMNLGNHEPEFYDVAETVRRLEAAGLKVISGNLRNPANGQPYAPATLKLTLGKRELTLVGITTDRLNTYRVAIRPQLDLADPAVWGRANFPALLRDAALPVVLSHAGLKADRALFGAVPAGTLFAGAHDHLRLVHREPGGPLYFHSGSWLETVSVATLHRNAADGTAMWQVEQIALRPEDPAEPELARQIAATLAQHLTAEETTVVGRTAQALSPSEAAAFAVAAARTAAGADIAVVGATTFGAGLPAGAVTRFAFDACVRFDGPLFAAEVDGAWLRRLVARCNHGPDTPFAARTGENLVAAAGSQVFEDGRRYRFVTTDWIAKNAAQYLGENPPELKEAGGLRLKAAVLQALAR